jgi:hypothetical protein
MAPDRGLTFIIRTKDEDGAAQRRRISNINAHTAFAAHERRRRGKGRGLPLKDHEGPSQATVPGNPQYFCTVLRKLTSK